jgi:hypothetical protein
MNLFVLGNSGHLLHLPEQKHWQADVVIGTNRIYRNSIDGRAYRPDSLVISDGRVWESDQKYIKHHPEVTLFIPDWWKLDYPHITFRSGYARKAYEKAPITDFTLDWYGYIHHINSVAFQAAQIALTQSVVGDSIYLLGIDSKWPPRGDVRRNQHHFYNDRSMEKALRPFATPDKFIHQWEALANFAAVNGRQMFNCSPWDDLTIPNVPKAPVPVKG